MAIQTNPDLLWMVIAKRFEKAKVREVGSTNKGPELKAWIEELTGSKIDESKKHWLYGQPWCGIFAAICLKHAGFSKGTIDSRKGHKGRAGPKHYPYNYYGAAEYVTEGGVILKKPCYGCLAVKGRKGGNHVTFVAGKTKDGRLVCLGGNQGNSVNYTTYRESEFDAFIWYGNTSTPGANRYDLPILNVTSSGVSES